MDDFTGKTAVVTGAGSGIGRALAQRFAAEGMRVVAADVEEGALEATAALIRDAGGEVTTVVTDVSDGDAVDALAERAFATYGQVDVLCNNAGVFQAGLLWERTAADLEWVLGVNLWGILHGIRAFVPRMIAQDTEGHVVNTASMAGQLSMAYSGPYVISKFAAVATSECLAHDLERTGAKIKASVLCPGLVDTAIFQSRRNRSDGAPNTEDNAFVEQVLQDTIAGGMARSPDEVAEIVLDAIRDERFLILTSPESPRHIDARHAALSKRKLPPTPEFVD
ncbi:MAG: SDR family NAD(P)-dependent oxidoreductase [Acidimicrobiia bacterium]